MPAEEMPERLRRFLLLPGPGGEEAERLGSPSAFYLGILVVPPEDRHSLALVLLELLALVSGLFVSVPLSFVRGSPALPLGASNSCDVGPTQEDGIDILAFLIFFTLASVAFHSVLQSLNVAAAGSRKSLRNFQHFQHF